MVLALACKMELTNIENVSIGLSSQCISLLFFLNTPDTLLDEMVTSEMLELRLKEKVYTALTRKHMHPSRSRRSSLDEHSPPRSSPDEHPPPPRSSLDEPAGAELPSRSSSVVKQPVRVCVFVSVCVCVVYVCVSGCMCFDVSTVLYKETSVKVSIEKVIWIWDWVAQKQGNKVKSWNSGFDAMLQRNSANLRSKCRTV